MSNSENLEREVRRLTQELDQAKSRLDSLQRNCQHSWSEVVYDPEEYREVNGISGILRSYPGEHIPYDEVPYHQEYSYVTKHRDRWKRTCKKCNKTEFTKFYEEKTQRSPKFT